MACLRLEVCTAECEEGTVYVHKLASDANKLAILEAVEILYGSEDVLSIYMGVEEEE